MSILVTTFVMPLDGHLWQGICKKKIKQDLFVYLEHFVCLFKTFYDKLWSTHERAHQPLVMF